LTVRRQKSTLEFARPEEATIEPQNAETFERLLSLRSGDYAELLMRGEVTMRRADPDRWRKQIRRQARLDRLRIRTGKSSRDPSLVWAIRLRDSDGEPVDDQAFLSTIAYQDDVQALARARAHTLERWIVYHEGRAAGRCTSCGARAFVDTTGDMPIVDGEVLDKDCPGFWSPPDETRP
jgi:hypothetical protein